MTTRRFLTGAMGATLLVGLAAPALADGFSFGFSYDRGPRYCYTPRTYVYRDYAPVVVYREYAPSYVVYDPPVRYYREYVPSRVVYRDYWPSYHRTYVSRSYCAPAYRDHHRSYYYRPSRHVSFHASGHWHRR